MQLTVDQLLTTTVQMEGSDLHLKAESPPLVRVHGDLYPLEMPPLAPEQVKSLAYSILSSDQITRFEEDLEFDLLGTERMR